MPDQLPLDLGPPPAPELLYFALRPDGAAARAMMQVARRCRERHGLSGRPYGADRLHLSLAPVVSRRGPRKGDVAAASDAAARVGAASFPVAFRRLCTFGGQDRRALVLCCDDGAAAVTALRDSLRTALARAGLWQGGARFRPHVTLLWDRRPVPAATLDRPIGWTVDGFVLVRSLVGRSRHVDLGRWPLHGGAGRG